MKSKINIGIDLDGTLADLMGAACERYNLLVASSKNKTIRPESIASWSAFMTLTGLSHSAQSKWLNDTWEEWEYISAFEIVENGILNKIHDSANVFIISHRARTSHTAVTQWLNKFLIPYDGLVLIEDHIDKLTFPIDILIDDHPRLANRKTDKKILLVTRPWNKLIENLTSNVFRMNTDNDIITWMIKNGYITE